MFVRTFMMRETGELFIVLCGCLSMMQSMVDTVENVLGPFDNTAAPTVEVSLDFATYIRDARPAREAELASQLGEWVYDQS
jgi:hypothetical protein